MLQYILQYAQNSLMWSSKYYYFFLKKIKSAHLFALDGLLVLQLHGVVGGEETEEGHSAVALHAKHQVAQGLGVALVHIQGLLVLEQVHHPIEGCDGDEPQVGILIQEIRNLYGRGEKC